MKKRKIILNLCTSLDSYIEGPEGQIDWCFTDQDYSMTELLDGVDTIFFGRKSYEQLIKEYPQGFPDKKYVVFSNTMDSSSADIQIIGGDIKPQIEQLIQEEGKNIWLFGGGSLVSDLLNLDLLDQLIISVHPLILGGGKPLFTDIQDRRNLHLTDVKTFSTGLVQLYYELGR